MGKALAWDWTVPRASLFRDSKVLGKEALCQDVKNVGGGIRKIRRLVARKDKGCVGPGQIEHSRSYSEHNRSTVERCAVVADEVADPCDIKAAVADADPQRPRRANTLTVLLRAKPAEVRGFLATTPAADRTREFTKQLRGAGVPV